MAKRLTEIQKKEILELFANGEIIEKLSQSYGCTRSTIIRNIKRNIGELKYKELLNKNKIKQVNSKKHRNLTSGTNYNKHSDEKIKKYSKAKRTAKKDEDQKDYISDISFVEIEPLAFNIDNQPRKELSSIPLLEMDFPKVVYMIVDRQVELQVKLIKDCPAWEFLPEYDLNRKAIEIFDDLKVARRFCKKEQKVIKVPNTDVFRMAAPFLLSRGISRIVSADKLIAI